MRRRGDLARIDGRQAVPWLRKARSLELVVAGSILVTNSYDRRVDIALQLRSGDKTVGAAALRNRSAAGGGSTGVRILLPVDEAALATALAAESNPSWSCR